jgi:hypothetical protein
MRWSLHHYAPEESPKNPTYALGVELRLRPLRLAARERAGMDTAREYRQRAAICLRLAHESRDAYVKIALTELASELSGMADTAESHEADRRWPKISRRELERSSG